MCPPIGENNPNIFLQKKKTKPKPKQTKTNEKQ